MRRVVILPSLALAALALSGLACSSTKSGSGFTDGPPVVDSGKITDGTVPSGDTSFSNPPPSGDGGFGMQDLDTGPPDGSVTVATTIYAHTDTALYSMDPTTMAVTPVGLFSGLPDAAYQSVTDLAVNAAGDVYVCTESVVYKAALPSTPSATASVPLTMVATISATSTTYFYALAFTPAGVLGTGEMLVGGDSTGELWSIDPSSGATVDLGNFGTDAQNTGYTYGVSGDLVFYMNAMNQPTGLATIRSCKTGTSTCYPSSESSDFLAGINMTALAAAYTSKTKATTLLGGIYGGSMTSPGNGTTLQKIFGLGAWQGNVYGFTRASTGSSAQPPKFVSISTTTGVASVIDSNFSFTDGWSGAGVTTTVTIVLPPPPQVAQ